MIKRDIYVVEAVRTAIGSFGGALKDVPPTVLGKHVIESVISRSQLVPKRVGHVVMGNVVPTGPEDAYLSRKAAIDAGIPAEVPAFNVNRLCGSGLQAIVSAAQCIAMGDTDIAIGGGAESMSRGPYILQSARWGARMGDTQLVDYMNGILHDPWCHAHMGVTAENVAERYGVDRAAQDALALESQRRAARALEEGRFDSQVVPIHLTTRSGEVVFDCDEHLRTDVSPESLAKMKPVFKRNGTVTAGNASGINDGAAALLLGSEQAVREQQLKPLARLVSYAHAGVDPEFMGIGPVPASRLALQRAGLSVADIDVVEANEAFAAQACAVIRELGLDPEKVNPNGSGISLGHPVGATGALIAVKAVHELHRIQGRYALVTLCIGGGQGIAVIFERVDWS